MWVLPLLVSHPYTSYHGQLLLTIKPGLRRPPPRLPLPYPRHSLRPLLPLRARRRALRPRAQNPQPHDLRRHRDATPAHPNRQTAPQPLRPQRRLAHPLPPKPAALPLGQAHRSDIPHFLCLGVDQPLRVVPALQHATVAAHKIQFLRSAERAVVYGDCEFLWAAGVVGAVCAVC